MPSPIPDPAISFAPQNSRQPSRGCFDAFFAPFRLQEMEQLVDKSVESLALGLPRVDLDDVDPLICLTESPFAPELPLDDADTSRDDIAIGHEPGHTPDDK